MFAKVILDIKHEEVNKAYDYHIPDSLVSELKKGMRVIVPFGAQTRMGFVISIFEISESATKDIIEILDVIPTISDELFFIMDYMIENSLSLYSAVFDTVIPSGLTMHYDKDIYLLDEVLLPDEYREFFNKKGVWHLKKGDYELLPKLRRLHDKKIIEIKNAYKQKTNEKTVFVYRYNNNHAYEKISKYPQIESLNFNKSYEKKELEDVGFSTSHINTLVKHGVFIKRKTQIDRDIKHLFDDRDKVVVLTDEQKQASDQIKSSLSTHQTFLLKGITGSGKTEVYLDVIEKVVKDSKKVLVLVPEIMLIAPMAQRIKSRFDHVAIYHSALSSGEKYDQYQQILNEKVDVVISTRSGIFLPIQDLGLIIIDEEHDQSYMQKEGVIYDARKIAELRAKYHQIPLVLGSATPSIVSMYQASNKEITLLTLHKRPFELKEPHIYFVDMKKELNEKNTSIFSNVLKQKIDDRLAKKEQTLMLFNRKGYAPFVLCRQCGDVPKCPECDISLTYYKDKNILKCHYCGYEKPFSPTCEICHQKTVKEVGVGIEYVESQLKKTFPEARVLRMDKNVTTKKGSHEKIWHQFLNEEADILLGTQMISKGLDFPKVTLVGVLMADLSLKVPSYTASEETYMLLSQISGRSGRHLPGEVVIQGYQLDHYAITSVKKGYDTFYKEALYDRKISRYEPFYHVSQCIIEGPSYLKAYQKAFMLKKRLHTLNDVIALGPVPAFIKKIKDQYRFVVTIKFKDIDISEIKYIIESLKEDLMSIRYYPNLDNM